MDAEDLESYAPNANEVVLFDPSKAGCERIAITKPLNLEALRTLLKVRFVQMVPCTFGILEEREVMIWCDEEGLMNGSPENDTASRVLKHQMIGSRVCGRVLLAGPGAVE